jgi:hypothetical protein
MNIEMKIIREVSLEAEECYPEAVKLGDHAAYALKSRHRSQLTGLENIAESTFKTSDILDYAKKQIARFGHWRLPDPTASNPQQGFGERLKDYLEKELPTRVERICESRRLNIRKATDDDKQQRRHIYLLLMRQVIRQIVVQYEYRVSQENKQQDGARSYA